MKCKIELVCTPHENILKVDNSSELVQKCNFRQVEPSDEVLRNSTRTIVKISTDYDGKWIGNTKEHCKCWKSNKNRNC